MSFIDVIVIGAIAAVVIIAAVKIIRDKRRGVKCSGCEGCTKDCAERK